jgi:MFS family permease
VSTLAAIGGGLAVGWLADRYFQRRFKCMLLSLIGLCLVSFIWFTMSLPAFDTNSDRGMLPSSFGTILVSIACAGLFLGASAPLFFELALEITYPIPEATSGGIMTLFNNMGALLFLAIPPSFASSMNVVMTATVLMTFLLVFSVKEAYHRSDTEAN